MREFVYFSGKAVTTGNFKDLMKAGRMDIVCHIVIASFFVSNAKRDNVKLNLFFYGQPDPPKHLELISKKDEDNYISKKDVAGLIKRVLFKYKKDKKTEAFRNCFVEKKSLLKFVDELVEEKRNIYVLEARGEDVRDVEIGENPVFIMGDHEGFPQKELRRIRKVAKRVSIGKTNYFASQTMAVLQNELDRREIF